MTENGSVSGVAGAASRIAATNKSPERPLENQKSRRRKPRQASQIEAPTSGSASGVAGAASGLSATGNGGANAASGLSARENGGASAVTGATSRISAIEIVGMRL